MGYKLADFGSYTVGGRLRKTESGEPKIVNFTRDVSYEIDPRGTRAIEHAYVQYFIPEDRRDAPPVVLLHGGGMSGACWETTPDGRPGWLHLLLARGFEVHVMDNVERGRAGFAPEVWEGDPFLRTMEEAWSLFRFGDPENFTARTPHKHQKFPIKELDRFAASFVPRWFSTTSFQVDCLTALLRRLGPSIVICHSQGGQVAFDALMAEQHLAAGVIALEPSADPPPRLADALPPTVIVAGGFLDLSEFWQARRDTWRGLEAGPLGQRLRLLETDEHIGPGHSHMLMMDEDHHTILDAALRGLSVLRNRAPDTGPRRVKNHGKLRDAHK